MHKDHRKRLRKRFMQNSDFMEKHEILELLLTFSIPRKNTNEQAHSLLNTFGSIKEILDAPFNVLTAVEGIGPTSALFLKLIGVIVRLYLEETSPKGTVLTRDQIAKILMNKFVNREDEHLVIALFSVKMKLLYCDFLNKGNIHTVSTEVKDFLKLALKYKARYVIIAHNHPSGIALPSKEDIETTIYLREILKPFDILLIDHLIFADNDYISLAESGLKNKIFE